MDVNGSDRELIQGTIQDLTDTIERLCEEHDALEERLTEVSSRRDEWQARLSAIADNGQGTTKRRRARKGENLRTIQDFLVTLGPKANSTMAAIADETGIPWSSVRNELQREGAPFVEHDGCWFSKKQAGASDARSHD